MKKVIAAVVAVAALVGAGVSAPTAAAESENASCAAVLGTFLAERQRRDEFARHIQEHVPRAMATIARAKGTFPQCVAVLLSTEP